MLTENSSSHDFTRLRLNLFSYSLITAVIHLFVVYFFLTVNNPFNFNNNFHLIGFVSFLTFLVQLLLILLYGRLLQKKWLFNIENAFVNTNDPFTGLTGFLLLLTMLFFTHLAPLIYFLLINEFMLSQIQLVLWCIMGLSIMVTVFSYWTAIVAVLQKKTTIYWWSLINNLIVAAIFIVIFIVLLNFLTGIIPADLRPASKPYLSL